MEMKNICNIKIEFDSELKAYIATSKKINLEVAANTLGDLLDEVKAELRWLLNKK